MAFKIDERGKIHEFVEKSKFKVGDKVMETTSVQRLKGTITESVKYLGKQAYWMKYDPNEFGLTKVLLLEDDIVKL